MAPKYIATTRRVEGVEIKSFEDAQVEITGYPTFSRITISTDSRLAYEARHRSSNKKRNQVCLILTKAVHLLQAHQAKPLVA